MHSFFKKIEKTLTLQLICGGLVLLVFCLSCQPKPLPQDRLFVALESEIKNLDPRRSTDANSMRVINLIFTGFTKIGPHLKTLPDGVSHWEQKGLTYIFYLKPLKFSNGRHLTKEDILFSFQEFRKTASPFYSAFKNIKYVKAKKTKIGFTVEIRVKKYSATFVSADLPIIKLLPKKEITESKQSFLKNPIGTGEFKLLHKNPREILLKRMPSQAKPSPTGKLPKYISFQIIRDSFIRTQKMVLGKIDVAPSVIPVDKIYQFKNERFKILAQPSLSTTYLLLNLKNNLLKQKKVRKSLSLSINPKEIIKYKLKGYGVLAKTLMQPKSLFFNNKIAAPIYDLEKSKQIVKELGLTGKQLTLSVSNNPSSISKAKILASQISRSGLDIQIESYEWGTFYKDINQGNYEISLMKWVGVTDPDIYRVAFYSENQAPKGRNRSFYNNKNLDKLLELGVKEPNLKIRKQIYNKVQKQIAEEFIIIPLWHDMEVAIIKNNVKNYFVPINGDFSPLTQATKN